MTTYVSVLLGGPRDGEEVEHGQPLASLRLTASSPRRFFPELRVLVYEATERFDAQQRRVYRYRGVE